MTSRQKFYLKWCRPWWAGVLVLWLAIGVSAQEPPPQPSAPDSAQSGQAEVGQGQKAAGEGNRVTTEGAAQDQEAGGEHHIGPEEAKELFRSVDEILKFASKDTALPIKQEVKRRLTSRDQVAAYIRQHMEEDEDAQRLRRSELVLKKFGLLPRDFDLQSFLLALLREQVAGYYDPKTKTVNLLNWIDAVQQRPVLAHELTHALQDQSFGLEKWMKSGVADLNDKKNPSPDDIGKDETSAARQAVVEGQAMVVLVDYTLAPMGKSLLDSPQLVEALKAGMLVGTGDSVQFANAPIYLKEALTFPYRYGMDFTAELLTKGGKEKAFAEAFTHPPTTTRQIMEPQTYLSGEHIEPMPLPDFTRDFKDYDRFDIGAIGEFDVAILIDQYAGVEKSKELYPHWRGGYYYAGRPKADASAPLVIMYASRWSSTDQAAKFAAVYADALSQRYRRAREVVEDGKEPASPSAALTTLTGKHAWMTEEGLVVIEVKGDTVLVTEGLSDQTTEKVEHDLFPAARAGK